MRESRPPAGDALQPPAMLLPLEMTLIVAATRDMGIGRAGTLPWTGLKREMAYFARVTKRLAPMAADSAADRAGTEIPPSLAHPDASQQRPRMNAVIMGRKTWDSIPQRFRPLTGRLNVVLSRSYPELSRTFLAGQWEGCASDREPYKASSLAVALAALSMRKDVGRVFVIGGAEIYKAALEDVHAKRILLTRVLTGFECDTFFPVALDGDGAGAWTKKSKQELDQWAGEQVPDGVQDENGVRYVFEMYERDQAPAGDQ